MKKLFFFVAALCCGVAVLAADFRVDNLSYTIIDQVNFRVAVDTNAIPSGVEDFVIPSHVTYNTQEYTVTKIAYEALQTGTVKSITLPATLDTIANYAFKDVAVNVINFNEGLKYIGIHVLRNATQVTEISFPSTLVEIDMFAFYGTTAHKYTFNSPVKLNANSFKSNKIDTIICNSNTPVTLKNGTYGAFDNVFTTAKVFVPKSAEQSVLNAYKALAFWQNFTYLLEMGEEAKTFHNVTVNIVNSSYGTVKVNLLTKTSGAVSVIEEDSEVVLEVLPAAGNEIKSVKLGDADIVLTDGKFTLPALTQDTVFNVEFAATIYNVTLAVEGSAAYFTQHFYYHERCRLAANLNSGYKDMVITLNGLEVAPSAISNMSIEQDCNIVISATKDMPSEAPVAKSARLTTWNAGGHIFVSADGMMNNVKVYDLQGRQMLNKTDNSSLYILDSNNLNGYIIRATMADGSVETIKGM